ncbi:MAG: TIGR00730 family Rossman fold protein [Acutalibacteraceae bacterium]
MNITVYLGASPGNDPALGTAVKELGNWIGTSGHSLVYGGSKTGLMGELADSVLDSGGKVIGVEPQFFIDEGFAHDRLTELIVTKDMAERKTKMIELGDIFIAFPGGTGTLEEIAEVMSKVSLGQLDAPCILYNLNGYYDSLKTLLETMIEKGLSTKKRQNGIVFASTLEEIQSVTENRLLTLK